MTRKSVKRGLAVLGVAAALLVAAVAVLPLLVSGERFREEIAQRITEATGADVELGGIGLQVLPRLALKVGPSRVSGTGAGLRDASGSDHGIASFRIDLAEVDVRVGLVPLLRRRLDVGELKLTGTSLEVVRDGDTIRVRDFALAIRDLETGLVSGAPPAAGAPPGASIPADLACRADLRAGSVTVGDALYEEVGAEARLARRVLKITGITARRATGKLAGEATLDYADDPWGVLTFAGRADAVPAGALLQPVVPELAARLDAPLTTDFAGSCNLRDADAVLTTLALTGTAVAGDGVLHAGDWLADVSSYLGRRQDLKDVRFRGLDHGFRVEDGRYLVEKLEIDGLDTTWRGDGWIGLRGAIDLALHVKLPAGFTPDLGQWSFLADLLRDEEGRVQLDLRLTGRTARPDVSVDLSRLKEAASEQGGETLRQGVRSLLDKWKTK